MGSSGGQHDDHDRGDTHEGTHEHRSPDHPEDASATLDRQPGERRPPDAHDRIRRHGQQQRTPEEHRDLDPRRGHGRAQLERHDGDHATEQDTDGQVDEDALAAAIEALIPLTADSDADVRDWATFAIGTQSDADYPELREALVQRLDDKSSKVREEAIAGLAKRKDTRAVVPLFKLMRRGSYFVHHSYDFGALVDAEESAKDWGPDEFIDALYEKFPDLLPARRTS